MTIAISVKVHDGVVFAADSATTLVGTDPNKQPYAIKVYNNANKIFNLHKGLPIAGMTWGSGSIGQASISTLAKDLRQRFSGQDASHKDWKLDPETYNVKHVAEATRKFLFEELYQP